MITKSFPIHNSISLLLYNSNKEDEINYLKFKKIIDDNINLSFELNNYNDNIKQLFKNKYNDEDLCIEQFKYFEIKKLLFDNNKEILKYLTDFCFLIIAANNGKKITIYFKNMPYHFKTFEEASYKQILIGYSPVPLAIKIKK